VDEILEDEVDGVHHLLEVAEVTEDMEHHSGEAKISGVAVEATEDIEADGVEEMIAVEVHTEVEDEVEVLEDHVVEAMEAVEVPLLAVMEDEEDRLEEVHTAEVGALIQAVLTAEAEVEIQAHMEALLKEGTAVREEDGVHNNAEAAEEETVGKTKAFSHIETDESILKKMKHERFEKNNTFFTPGLLIFNNVSYFLFKK